jgi:hypothetical protein
MATNDMIAFRFPTWLGRKCLKLSIAFPRLPAVVFLLNVSLEPTGDAARFAIDGAGV